MMRCYLFRGKVIHDDDNGYKKGKWVYGSLLVDVLNNAYIFDYGTNDKVQVDSDTIGQFVTQDVNGKNAYEGDIIEGEDGEYGFIELDEESRSTYTIKYNSGYNNRSYERKLFEINIAFYVVGNRWDNPKLLLNKEEEEE